MSFQTCKSFVQLHTIEHIFNEIWNRSIHMDEFYDLFMSVLKRQSGSCIECQWRDRNLTDFNKNIFICVLKMNKRTTCEWVNDDSIFIFGWTIPLKEQSKMKLSIFTDPQTWCQNMCINKNFFFFFVTLVLCPVVVNLPPGDHSWNSVLRLLSGGKLTLRIRNKSYISIRFIWMNSLLSC